MKNSEILQACKAHLERERFICRAITAVCGETSGKGKKIKAHVMELLEGSRSLEMWLCKQAYGFEADFIHHATDTIKTRTGISFEEFHTKLRETRQRWVDHLIDHYEAQGQ